MENMINKKLYLITWTFAVYRHYSMVTNIYPIEMDSRKKVKKRFNNMLRFGIIVNETFTKLTKEL